MKNYIKNLLLISLLGCASFTGETSICKEDEVLAEDIVFDIKTESKQFSIIKDLSNDINKFSDYGDINISFIKGEILVFKLINADSNVEIYIEPEGKPHLKTLLVKQNIIKDSKNIQLDFKISGDLLYKYISSGPIIYTFVFSGTVPNDSNFKSKICIGIVLESNKSLLDL